VNVSNLDHDIKPALQRARIDSERVSVKVRDGQVKLSGKVRALQERAVAEATAWAAPGAIAAIHDIAII
jgi:osmotically-inducible protein OsmY